MSPRKIPEVRRRYIKNNVGLKPIKDIAEDCGVSEKTIDRDISHMKGTGEWHDFIEWEALRLHREVALKEDPMVAYKEFMRLYGKTIPQISHVETDGNISIVVEMWTPDGDKDPDKVSPT